MQLLQIIGHINIFNMRQYSEKTFIIDLVSEEYKTIDPNIIQDKIKEIFDKNYTISEIKDYLNYEEDYEKESWRIKMSEIF